MDSSSSFYHEMMMKVETLGLLSLDNGEIADLWNRHHDPNMKIISYRKDDKDLGYYSKKVFVFLNVMLRFSRIYNTVINTRTLFLFSDRKAALIQLSKKNLSISSTRISRKYDKIFLTIQIS